MCVCVKTVTKDIKHSVVIVEILILVYSFACIKFMIVFQGCGGVGFVGFVCLDKVFLFCLSLFLSCQKLGVQFQWSLVI